MPTLEPITAFGPIRVLIIDDDDMFISLVCRIFEHEGGGEFICESERTLAGALRFLAERSVDVVLADLNLTDSEGIGTVRSLLAATRVPVVVMSAVDDLLIAHKAMRLGVQAFLVKGEEKGRHLVRAVQFAVERCRAAEKLARSEQRFRDFAEIAGDWFWETGPDLRITWVSERVQERLGLDPASLVGRLWEDLMIVDDGSGRYQARVRALEPFRNVMIRLTAAPDRVLRTGGKPVFSATTRFLGYRGVTTDVSEEVEAERFAARMLAILSESLASYPSGVMIFDASDRLLLVNDRVYSLLPVRGDAFLPGVTFLEILRMAAEDGVLTAAAGRVGAWLDEWRDRKLHQFQPVREPTQSGRDIFFHQHQTASGGMLRLMRFARSEEGRRT